MQTVRVLRVKVDGRNLDGRTFENRDGHLDVLTLGVACWYVVVDEKVGHADFVGRKTEEFWFFAGWPVSDSCDYVFGALARPVHHASSSWCFYLWHMRMYS